MSGAPAGEDRTVDVAWRRAREAAVPNPLDCRTPYLELVLEHPDLEATRYDERFFPDAMPYAFDGERRVFYWRPALAASVDPGEWTAVCATTHALTPIADGERSPDLVARADGATEVVAEGCVAGESTTTRLESYTEPDVEVATISESAVELSVDGESYAVEAGDRRRIPLSERTAELADRGGGEVVTSPRLVVRYPGTRRLYHPAPGAEYRLFPSFGLDLEAIPSPVAVPVQNGELDHEALARALGVDPTERPYPERVLWQAFAYTTFDPNDERTACLMQFPTGQFALLGHSDE